jgi:hypothetical protein
MAELGNRYRDRVTGYEGTATGRAEYLDESPSVQMTRADSAGKPESIWLPEGRLDPADHDRDRPGFAPEERAPDIGGR